MTYEVKVFKVGTDAEYNEVHELVSTKMVDNVNTELAGLWHNTPFPEDVHYDSVQWLFGSADANGVHLNLASVSSGGIEESILAVSFREVRD